MWSAVARHRFQPMWLDTWIIRPCQATTIQSAIKLAHSKDLTGNLNAIGDATSGPGTLLDNTMIISNMTVSTRKQCQTKKSRKY